MVAYIYNMGDGEAETDRSFDSWSILPTLQVTDQQETLSQKEQGGAFKTP